MSKWCPWIELTFFLRFPKLQFSILYNGLTFEVVPKNTECYRDVNLILCNRLTFSPSVSVIHLYPCVYEVVEFARRLIARVVELRRLSRLGPPPNIALHDVPATRASQYLPSFYLRGSLDQRLFPQISSNPHWWNV